MLNALATSRATVDQFTSTIRAPFQRVFITLDAEFTRRIRAYNVFEIHSVSFIRS